MKNYNLLPNEVLLYNGTAYRVGENKGQIELILTNLNFVFIARTKKLFSKEEFILSIFPIEELKIYDETPQIIQTDYRIVLYFTTCEITLDFTDKGEIRKIISAALKLLTGKDEATRNAESVNGAIGVVNRALGIDTVDTVKSILENGVIGTVIGGFKKNDTKTQVVQEALSVMSNEKTDESNLLPEYSSQTTQNATGDINTQIESLKKLKELLDAGILTQDEFDVKKKQILGL